MTLGGSGGKYKRAKPRKRIIIFTIFYAKRSCCHCLGFSSATADICQWRNYISYCRIPWRMAFYARTINHIPRIFLFLYRCCSSCGRKGLLLFCCCCCYYFISLSLSLCVPRLIHNGLTALHSIPDWDLKINSRNAIRSGQSFAWDDPQFPRREMQTP